jgi:ABC-type Zn uptake system ZnuABC Zn-binding protein ZnuA
MGRRLIAVLISLGWLLSACLPDKTPTPGGPLQVLAVESFLADITQNIAGDHLQVQTLIPAGLDPHAYEPNPADVIKISDSQVLVVNGSGLEEWLVETLRNAGGDRQIIEASAGLEMRTPREGEILDAHTGEGDPHFWLNPLLVIKYVENIRDGLSLADPDGAPTYQTNAEVYIRKLTELDAWISSQVAQIPAEQRLMVTNHESFGYFADRYGFIIIGTVIPSASTGSSPTARQLAELVTRIKETGTKAIFLETGANPQLAEQVAREAGIKVITDLYTHSLTTAGGVAPTYIEIMRHNTQTIISALK